MTNWSFLSCHLPHALQRRISASFQSKHAQLKGISGCRGAHVYAERLCACKLKPGRERLGAAIRELLSY